MVKLLASYNEQVSGVVLGNAPQNAKYTSPDIQKEILHVIANKVRNTIRSEIGEAKFCIIVDEARDESKREQMAIVLRFVDKKGFVQEHFFDLVHVRDTSALTLKTDISKVLSNHNLNVKDIRGQGYDGASNMRGEWNGLQALFLQECPYAYYVHCLAHRLQLALVAASREVIPIHQFFSNLTFIINVVGASCKRHDELQAYHAAEIAQLVAAQELESGRGLNQMTTLKRAGDTRWGSHLNSISSLIQMFNSVRSVLSDITIGGSTYAQRGDADAAYNMNEISIPDMSSNYAGSRGRSRRQKDPLTVEHHYRIEVFLAGLDSQLQELNTRFSDHTMDLLILSAALDPQDRYKSFNINNICELVDKFYPDDFTEQEKYHLKYELQHYELDVPYHVDLQEVKTIETVAYYDHEMQILEEACPGKAELTEDMSPEQWALAYDENMSFGKLMTNSSASVNSLLKWSRSLPVQALVSAIFYQMNAWFVHRRDKVADYNPSLSLMRRHLHSDRRG
ncbi:hypothetical protein H6P81_002778 [Aristolochia fimbriata]|uniref:DUF4371 domain-containing protein n=1 Tax=Aristolochia fimbriata TaxID=158543 RepID=A0AAV7FAP9_ARIFI|nr:hypothetical protein H6P81_002778 [Aristolochia fimbriata]